MEFWLKIYFLINYRFSVGQNSKISLKKYLFSGKSVFNYVTGSTEITPERMIRSVGQIDDKAKGVLMTGLEKTIQKGVRKGLQQGIAQGAIKDKQIVLTRQLHRKFGLNESEEKFISSIEDADKLDLALDKILFTDDKDEVLKILER